MNDSVFSQSPRKPVANVMNDNWIDIDRSNLSPQSKDDLDTVERLLDHLNMINELQDQMDAIDFLSNNAEKLAENPTYTTADENIITAIADLGASGTEVNFELFKYAIDIILEGYRQMSIITLSGVKSGT